MDNLGAALDDSRLLTATKSRRPKNVEKGPGIADAPWIIVSGAVVSDVSHLVKLCSPSFVP